MRPTVPSAIAAAVLLGPILPAAANDSTAELGAGGLRLVRNDNIAIVSENLYVSADAIRVAYRFRNKTDSILRYVVAFPLPAIDAVVPEETNFVLPNPGDDNFVDFQVTADGQLVAFGIDARATALGVDWTDELKLRGLPLNPLADGINEAIDNLAPPDLQALNERGLVIVDDYSRQSAWRLEAAFYWDQVFPPGRDVVVEHSYRPVAGYGFFGEHVLTDPYYLDKYCIDDAFARAARTKLAALAGSMNPYLDEVRVSYILTTANNWSGPIGTFRLVVDKGDPDALVSFCGENVRKISPTEFEVTADDYVPLRELDILIARPANRQQ